jgi:hypothetical protein
MYFGGAIRVLAVLATAAACAREKTAAPVCDEDRAAAEAEIRRLSASYASVRDVKTEVAEFTDDVWFYSPLRSAPTVNLAERRAVIEGRRAPLADEYTVRETTGVLVSQCSDLAAEHGRFVTRWAGPAGPDSLVGYYLEVWRKVNGEWKIAAASVHRSTPPTR